LSRRHPERARELAKEAIALQETVVKTTKENSNRRELAASQYALARAERDLGNAGRACDLFNQSAATFRATSPSTYLDKPGEGAEQALATCQGGATAVRAR
jgi:hypothetical protein